MLTLKAALPSLAPAEQRVGKLVLSRPAQRLPNCQ
jgi:hypothetical protein